MFDFLKTKKNYENVGGSAFRKLKEENPSAVLLDVRTADEFKQGAIKGAINIDIMNSAFNQKIAQLNKDKTYLVYCRSGNRSGSACAAMANLGFTKLYNLSGGLGSY
jgi:phage shock protein E